MSIQKHILADPSNKVKEIKEEVKPVKKIEKAAEIKIKEPLQKKPKKKKNLWARLRKWPQQKN